MTLQDIIRLAIYLGMDMIAATDEIRRTLEKEGVKINTKIEWQLNDSARMAREWNTLWTELEGS